MGKRILTPRDLSWTTESVPADERFAYWSDTLRRAFGPLEVERLRTGPFFGVLQSRATGPLTVAQIASEVRRVRRTEDMADRQPGGSFFLIVQLRGTGTACQGSRAAKQHPGDFILLDGSKPLELTFSAGFHQMCVSIPAEMVARRLVMPERVTATRVPADEGLATMIVRRAGCLAFGAPVRLDAEAAQRIAEHFVDLIALALGRARSDNGAKSRELLLQAALDVIDRRLAEPSLSPSEVAQHLNISTRYLHRLFRELGPTFGRWLITRRLECCARDLGDPALWHLTIAEIAARNGFSDRTHFARSFRASYEEPASSYRRSRIHDRQPG